MRRRSFIACVTCIARKIGRLTQDTSCLFGPRKWQLLAPLPCRHVTDTSYRAPLAVFGRKVGLLPSATAPISDEAVRITRQCKDVQRLLVTYYNATTYQELHALRSDRLTVSQFPHQTVVTYSCDFRVSEFGPNAHGQERESTA